MRKISGEWISSYLDCVDYSVYICRTHHIVHVEFIVYQLQHKNSAIRKRTNGGSHLHCLLYAFKPGRLSIISPQFIDYLTYYWLLWSTETFFIPSSVRSNGSFFLPSLSMGYPMWKAYSFLVLVTIFFSRNTQNISFFVHEVDIYRVPVMTQTLGWD